MIHGPVTIAAGTENPAKLEAIRRAATDMFSDARIVAVTVETGVPEQPWGEDQTAGGAAIRARAALATIEADYGIGLESGLADGPGSRIYVVSWAVAVNTHGRTGFGGSERFPVPVQLEQRLRAGSELGPLLDEFFGRPGLAREEGAVSIFTGGRRTRSEILSVAVLHALAAILEPWTVPEAPPV